MEQSLFSLIFSISFIIFLISVFYKKDYQLQGIFAGIAFIFFAILAIQSLNIEITVYDATDQEFKYSRSADRNLEYLVPIGFSLILMVFSLLNVFIIYTHRAWTKAITDKPMKINGGNGMKL